MRQHLNIVTLVVGILIASSGVAAIGPLVGIAVVGFELYRSYRIAALTSDISADLILNYYRSDSARRYFDANSAAKEIRKFATAYHLTGTEVMNPRSDVDPG